MGHFLPARADSLLHAVGETLKPSNIAHKLADEAHAGIETARGAASATADMARSAGSATADYARRATAAIERKTAAAASHLPSLHLSDIANSVRSSHLAETVRHAHLPHVKVPEIKVPEAVKNLHLPSLHVTDYLPHGEKTKPGQVDSPMPQKPGDYHLHMSVDGKNREFKLHLPPQYDGKKELPVVVFYHCLFSDPDEMSEFTKLSQKADKEGFIVVYPSAEGWLPNSSPLHLRQFWVGDAGERGKQETRFAKQLIDKTQSELKIDNSRIYVAGYSNGAMMAQKVAAEDPRVAAAASICGTQLGDGLHKPKQGVSIMLFNGDRDKLVPSEGTRSFQLFGIPRFRSANFSRDFWRDANGATQSETHTLGNGRVSEERFVNPKTGNEVVQYRMKQAGHCWPGADTAMFGPMCEDLNATDLMWNFFKRHHK